MICGKKELARMKESWVDPGHLTTMLVKLNKIKQYIIYINFFLHWEQSISKLVKSCKHVPEISYCHSLYVNGMESFPANESRFLITCHALDGDKCAIYGSNDIWKSLYVEELVLHFL